MYKKYEELLEKNNTTSYRVSKDTGIAQSILSDWKTGRSTPKLDKLITIAKYFSVPLTYFTDDNEEGGPTNAQNHANPCGASASNGQ